MLILAFDTSLDSCSVTIFKNREIIDQKVLFRKLGSSEIILPMIQDLISQTKTKFEEINLIGVSRGPGSYTGVRVGISVAKGLSLGLKIPIIGISSLHLLAYEASQQAVESREIIAVNKARDQEIYFQSFTPSADPLCFPKRIHCKELLDIISGKNVIITGNFIDELSKFKNINKVLFYKNMPEKYISSTMLASIINNFIENKIDLSNFICDPIYLNS